MDLLIRLQAVDLDRPHEDAIDSDRPLHGNPPSWTIRVNRSGETSEVIYLHNHKTVNSCDTLTQM